MIKYTLLFCGPLSDLNTNFSSKTWTLFIYNYVTGDPFTDFMNTYTIKDAIYVAKAWKELNPVVIQKCINTFLMKILL